MPHTNEPWPEPEHAHAGTGECAVEWWRIPSVGDFKTKANADRARECVNACAGLDDIGFIGLARQALDVMMRRGWYPVFLPSMFGEPAKWRLGHPNVGCRGFNGLPPFGLGPWGDPFTALVESDKWYRENVEDKMIDNEKKGGA